MNQDFNKLQDLKCLLAYQVNLFVLTNINFNYFKRCVFIEKKEKEKFKVIITNLKHKIVN